MFIGFHAKVLQDFFYVLRLSKPNHFMLLISQYLDSKKKKVNFPKSFISNSCERYSFTILMAKDLC